jgi:hypothetical protein
MTCRKTSASPRLGGDFRGIRLVGGSRSWLGALACMLYAQIVLNMAHARDLLGGEFRTAALNAVFDRTAQRDLRIMDIHFDVRSVDIGIIAQIIGDVLANAFIGALVSFRSDAVVTSMLVTIVASPPGPFVTAVR